MKKNTGSKKTGPIHNGEENNFVRGRFKEDISEITANFTSSLDIDKKLGQYDIQGSIAHLHALLNAGLISAKEKKELEGNLLKIKKELEKGELKLDKRYEDIHMNIEKRLIELSPVAGPRLHTARSRNDQVSIDFRLYVRDAIKKTAEALVNLNFTLIKTAKKNIETLVPGYTHLQHAQPVSLAHHLLAYCEMFNRDLRRLENAYEEADVLTLGSGALAGVDFAIDRKMEAEILKFKKVSGNSMDGVSDRDFAIQFSFALSMIIMHLSRFCEELIIWNTEEFKFIELKDEFTTGSSIMPQKKNPDVLELIRGKAGGVISGMLSLFIMMKSLPLTYNRDMQEDKKPVMESAETVLSSIVIFDEIIKTVKFDGKKMLSGLKDDFIYATDIATYLVNKGIPFRKSHETVGIIVNYAKSKARKLSEISLGEYKNFEIKIEKDLFNIFNPLASVNLKKTYGGTAISRVKEALVRNEKENKKIKKAILSM